MSRTYTKPSLLNRLAELIGWRKSLAEELAEVCDTVVQLRKKGLNEEDPDNPYPYLAIVDMCDELKGELFQRGIMFVPTDLEQEVQQISDDRDGRTIERCVVRTSFELVRKNERLSMGASLGSARDRSDKALAIAQTAAFKAWLKRITMIYGREDDPEAKRDSATPREAVRASSYQKRAWGAGVRDSGVTPETISAELTKLMGFPIDSEQIPSLPQADFENCMKWLLSHQDLTGPLAASVEQIKAKKIKKTLIVPIRPETESANGESIAAGD